ncbi:hypothetical protein [Pseudochrobactrum kiredjianiae]|uniref:Uncharacterized protein n=1 Tax=Pseudochrobactrum kiredjianiae TaxID=386305 RepID=A0ABW3V905_9HYPH|nr:hypothetical protein [Pseudochrobactrum kiredjianiae]MDM7851577.1 hypothetical protein [Pseudochrobactrum kiredjianiae]
MEERQGRLRLMLQAGAMTRDCFIRKHLSSFLTDKHHVMRRAEHISVPVGSVRRSVLINQAVS